MEDSRKVLAETSAKQEEQGKGAAGIAKEDEERRRRLETAEAELASISGKQEALKKRLAGTGARKKFAERAHRDDPCEGDRADKTGWLC